MAAREAIARADALLVERLSPAMAAREAIARADALLVERLSPEQREDFRTTKSFLVVTTAGRRYRLHADRVNFQADLLAPDSEYVLASYCVQPRDSLVPKSDSLLTQMLLLQSDEAAFLLIANVHRKVNNPARFLNGEIRPRAPEARPTGVERSQAAVRRIVESRPCADHNLPVVASRETDDGRGLDLHYSCGCPPQYVSFRQFEQREQEQQARATQTVLTVMDNPLVRNALIDAATAQMENLLTSFGVPAENVMRHTDLREQSIR